MLNLICIVLVLYEITQMAWAIKKDNRSKYRWSLTSALVVVGVWWLLH